MVKKVRYQLFKNGSVVLFEKHRNANGADKISNLTKIYLNAKLASKVIAEIDRVAESMPFSENILKLFEDVFCNVLIKD